MSNHSFILTSSGMKNINHEKKDFVFIFGEKEIKMNNLYAEFFSPTVSRIHLSDPTINSITIKYPHQAQNNFPSLDDLMTEDIQILVQELSSGSKVLINDEQIYKLRIVSLLVGNEDFYQQLNQQFPINIDISNIDRYLTEIQIVECISSMNSPKIIDLSSIVDDISSNFYSIDQNKLKKLPTKILFSVISNEKLKIESEDSLFDFIQEINFKDNEYNLNDFIELILIPSLSDEKFKELISKINPNEITSTLWQNLCLRICNCSDSNVNQSIKRYIQKIKEYLFDGNNSHSFKGIIHHLMKESDQDLKNDKCIIATSSSEENSNCQPKNALDLNNNSNFFCSKDRANSWIKYDFLKKKVRPTHYSIRSKHFDASYAHPKNWVIEGSNTNDDNDWKILDSRNNIKCLTGESLSHTFEIQQKLQPNEFYRYLRLRQTGLSASGNNYLTFSSLEYFGKVK